MGEVPILAPAGPSTQGLSTLSQPPAPPMQLSPNGNSGITDIAELDWIAEQLGVALEDLLAEAEPDRKHKKQESSSNALGKKEFELEPGTGEPPIFGGAPWLAAASAPSSATVDRDPTPGLARRSGSYST